MSRKLSHVLLIGVGLFSSTWVMAAVKEYDLTIAEQTVNITGKPLKRITVNGLNKRLDAFEIIFKTSKNPSRHFLTNGQNTNFHVVYSVKTADVLYLRRQ